MSAGYDELAARAEHGDLKVKPGTARRGPEVAADAQRLLMEATGATSFDGMTRIALGRPRAEVLTTDLLPVEGAET